MPDLYGWDNMGANLQFFNLTGGSSGGGVTDVTATPPITSTGGTTPIISTSMNTNRLIGRSSAGVGVMQEIQVGDGLTLSGGVLTAVTGITALNGLTADVQTFQTGTSGTDFNIDSSGSTHTFNIPSASNLARGLVSILAQTFAGVKTFLSAPILDSLTASRILATDGSKAVQSLDTATYPDLTELSYVKGVTSAIQTQLNSKISVSKSILIGNHGASTIATGVTSYGGFVKNNLTTAAQSFNVRTIMPTACVFRNWSVQIGTQPATGSCVFTMQIDAVDTAYTLTIAAGSVTGVYQNTIGSLNVANASAITYKITNNASTSTGAVVAVSIQVEI